MVSPNSIGDILFISKVMHNIGSSLYYRQYRHLTQGSVRKLKPEEHNGMKYILGVSFRGKIAKIFENNEKNLLVDF